MSSRRSVRTRPPKGDQRERALLDAGHQLLVAGSFDDASVADLAEAAGISRATFYFYFASKQALLGAVVADAVAGLEGRLDAERTAVGSSPSQRVAATVRAASDLWREHRVVLVASVELGATVPELYELTMASIDTVTDLTVSLLAAAGHVGALADPEGTTRLVTALVLMSERNFYDLARRAPRAGEHDVLVETLTTIWLRALALTDS